MRIIGINTPEEDTHEGYSKEAREFAEETLLNKKVYLESDISERDQYGRELKYIWVEIPKNTSINELEEKNYSAMVLSGGYGTTYTFKPNVKYRDEFRKIAKRARKNRVGMWELDSSGTTRGNNLNDK